MLVPQPVQLMQRNDSLSQTPESIECRVGDRGFWLQNGCAVNVLSCGQTDDRGPLSGSV